MPVTDIDNGADSLLRKLRLAKKAQRVVDVGILGQEAASTHEGGEEDGGGEELTIGEIAAIHELGLGVVPRPFLRGYVDGHRPEIEDRIRLETRRLLLGKTRNTTEALERLGIWLQGEIQDWMADPGNNLEPNTPETILRKGSAMPLIDTGQLRSSVSYVVRSRSDGS